MAHHIESTDNMAYFGEVPWHGLGNSMPAGASFEEWLKAANMDWHILSQPSGYMTPDGTWHPLDGMVENVRSDTLRSFGRVSEYYKPFQPKDALRWAADVAEEIGGTMETAGTLFHGAHYWAMIKLGKEDYIRDPKDKVGSYILISSSADGSRATDARRTTIRVVCNNTLTAALGGKKGAKDGYRVTHKSEFDATKARETLGINVHNVMEEFHREMETFRALANTPLVLNEILELTGTLLYGEKYQDGTAAEKAKMLEKQAARNISNLAVTGRNLIGAQLEGGFRTGWSWLNAVTQYVDHDARAHNTDQATAQENRIDSAWFGKGAQLKRDAVGLITRYTGKGQATQELVIEGPPVSSSLDDILANTQQAA
jgi:phage/plasmid-like protein (TIGR03299 family)